MSRKLWLLRHAESEWNAVGRWQGLGDPALSERGREQSALAGERLAADLARESVARLHCSRLQRAVETASAIGPALGLEPIPVEGLHELDVGRWTGLTTEEIRAAEPELLRAFETGDPDVRPGDGETRREMRARLLRAISTLAPEPSGGAILCVVHLGVIRLLVPGAEPGNLELASTTFDALARSPGFAAVQESDAPL